MRGKNISGISYRKYISRFFVYIMLSLFALTAIVPFVFSFSTSIKGESEYYYNQTGFPVEPTLDNFRFVLFDASLLRFLGNTIILVAGGLFLYLLICSAAGFAFGKLSFSFGLGLVVLFIGLNQLDFIINFCISKLWKAVFSFKNQ